jgi:hypothetical protein
MLRREIEAEEEEEGIVGVEQEGMEEEVEDGV